MRSKRVLNPEGKMASMMGKNGMTNESQVTLCRYYKGAILSNTDNVDGMINDIQAVFHHCRSTDQNLQHSFCPKGEYSWCKFNKYMHEKAKNPNTDMPMPTYRTEVINRIFNVDRSARPKRSPEMAIFTSRKSSKCNGRHHAFGSVSSSETRSTTSEVDF